VLPSVLPSVPLSVPLPVLTGPAVAELSRWGADLSQRSDHRWPPVARPTVPEAAWHSRPAKQMLRPAAVRPGTPIAGSGSSGWGRSSRTAARTPPDEPRCRCLAFFGRQRAATPRAGPGDRPSLPAARSRTPLRHRPAARGRVTPHGADASGFGRFGTWGELPAVDRPRSNVHHARPAPRSVLRHRENTRPTATCARSTAARNRRRTLASGSAVPRYKHGK